MHYPPTSSPGDRGPAADRSARPYPHGQTGGPEVERFILLADEDDIVNDLVAHRLARLGVASRCTTEGDEVEALLRDPGCRAAMISVHMPGASGFELLAAARDPSLGWYIPVIMLTWPGSTELVVRALESGADDVVEKPFVPAELIARLKRLTKPGRLRYG